MRELKMNELAQVSGAGYPHPKGDEHDSGNDKNKKNQGNNGYGNGGKDGVPGNSNKQDKTR